ncbi:MAG: hypothetical protein H6892_04895 [Brucellaceae bacterium]|nr:hypothetical protein [Brucellaceae bacterium]
MPTTKIDIRKDFPEQYAAAREMLDFHIQSKCYSDHFLFQFVVGLIGIPRWSGEKQSQIDTHEVLNQIDYLEGRISHTNTKGPLPFRDPSLVGLMHKHYSSAFDMPANLAIEFRGEGGRKIRNFLEARIGKKPTEDDIKMIAHLSVTDGYETRAQRRRTDPRKGLTGEWIVYQPLEGINHYLFLGYHDMSNAEIREWADGALDSIKSRSTVGE